VRKSIEELSLSSVVKGPKFYKDPVMPTRRYKKPEQFNLPSEMLSAGTDPLSKNQDFSILASNPQNLISAKFEKPPPTEMRFSAILDKYSRFCLLI